MLKKVRWLVRQSLFLIVLTTALLMTTLLLGFVARSVMLANAFVIVRTVTICIVALPVGLFVVHLAWEQVFGPATRKTDDEK